jgi:hypothetical protein
MFRVLGRNEGTLTNWEFLYYLLESGHATDLGKAFDMLVPDKRHDGEPLVDTDARTIENAMVIERIRGNNTNT